MKLDSIYTGKEFKNYIELCSTLKETEKKGKSRQLQIKEWNRYFSFRKEKHKIIITEVYDSPKEKKDFRQLGGKRKYLPYLEILIRLIPLEHKTSYTPLQMASEIGIYPPILKNLYLAKDEKIHISKKNAYAKKHKIHPSQIDDFHEEYKNKLNEIVYAAVNNLSKRKHICLRNTILIKTSSGIKEAEEDLQQHIERLEKCYLFNMKLSSREAMYKNKYPEINKKVLADSDLKNAKYYYKAFGLSSMNRITLNEIKEILSERDENDEIIVIINNEKLPIEEKEKEIKSHCIELIYEHLIEYMEKKMNVYHQKSIEKPTIYNEYRQKEEYLTNTKVLIQLLKQ